MTSLSLNVEVKTPMKDEAINDLFSCCEQTLQFVRLLLFVQLLRMQQQKQPKWGAEYNPGHAAKSCFKLNKWLLP